MQRLLWLCPILTVLFSILVLFYWGWSWACAGLIAFALLCLAVTMIRGAFHEREPTTDHVKTNKRNANR